MTNQPLTEREQHIMRTAWELGRQHQVTVEADDWAAQLEAADKLRQEVRETAERVARGEPSHAELEARRWGPGGREHFGDPRPGDYPGRDTQARRSRLRADLNAQMDDPEPELEG